MAAGQQIQKGHAMAALVVGVLECLLALIVIICSFVLAGKAQLSKTLTPYWAGIPFLIPGILGIATGITKNKCTMIANLVLNIICFVIQGVSTILVGIVIAFWAAFATAVNKHLRANCTTYAKSCKCRVNNSWHTVHGVEKCEVVSSMISLMYGIIAMLIIACIVALAGSIIGCVAVCCQGNQQPTTIVVQQPVAYVNQPQAVNTYPGGVQQAPPVYGAPQPAYGAPQPVYGEKQ